MSNGEGTATLLEELETLQRSLKELQSVKGYVQVIQHALKLRCVQILIYHTETKLHLARDPLNIFAL
jgi:hypothetical protein